MFELPPPEDDGLLIPEVREWSKDKHYYLRRYIDGFTTSMKSKRWSSLHYVDLFAGAGKERIKDSGELEWGSPLIAAHAKTFERLHVCEQNKRKYDALGVRLSEIASNVQIIHDDANEAVHEIVRQIPARSLSVAFLDPYGSHLWFETLKTLATRRMDLLIFFPDYLDMLRNCEKTYWKDPNSNLDRLLGKGVDWRSALANKPSDSWAEEFRRLYRSQLESLGYHHFEYERITAESRPLYLLIFCSRHPMGAKIWQGISQKKADQQQTFDFGSS
jgi:three-Cys-motif partner protein